MVHLEGWKAFLKVFQINHPIADQVTAKSGRGWREVTGGRKVSSKERQVTDVKGVQQKLCF